MIFEVWDGNEVARVEAEGVEEAAALARERDADDFEMDDETEALVRPDGGEWEPVAVLREYSPTYVGRTVASTPRIEPPDEDEIRDAVDRRTA